MKREEREKEAARDLIRKIMRRKAMEGRENEIRWKKKREIVNERRTA